MLDTLQEIVSLQAEYSAANTPAMQRRGVLTRRTLPGEISSLGSRLRAALMGLIVRSIGPLAACSAILICGGAAPPRLNDNRVSEFPRNYPLAFRKFRELVPNQLLSIPYIGSLDNASGDGEIREIRMDGRTMLRAFSCMPHDCVNETLTVLFTPDQIHVIALAKIVNAKLRTSYVVMGQPNDRELMCLESAQKLDFDGVNRVC